MLQLGTRNAHINYDADVQDYSATRDDTSSGTFRKFDAASSGEARRHGRRVRMEVT